MRAASACSVTRRNHEPRSLRQVASVDFRSRDRIDALIIRMWAAFFILALLVIGLGWLWVRDTTSRLEHAEFGVCNRLQVVRDNTNRNGAILYEGVRVFRSSPSLDAASKRRLGRLLGVPQYQGPTDCRVAVDAPDSYMPPAPVPYAHVSVGLLRAQLRGMRP